MAILSPARQQEPVISHLQLLGRGKVRDSYKIDDEHMLVVATNGISIFDFVLNAVVPQKGAVLTAMNHYWLRRLENERGIPTHLIVAGAAIDDYLPRRLHKIPWLHQQAMVVRRLEMANVEFVARGYLTGSGLKSYQETGTVCGIKLPPGLQDGDELPHAIDTPTTKAEEGHDLPLDADEVGESYPTETGLTLEIYALLRYWAGGRGIILADTKFEFGRDKNGLVIVADEVGTPDSSRYWEELAWKAGRQEKKHKAPPPFDKQIVREWGITHGVNKLNPLVPADVDRVQSLQVPKELIQDTTDIYLLIFHRLTGMPLYEYQRKRLSEAALA